MFIQDQDEERAGESKATPLENFMAQQLRVQGQMIECLQQITEAVRGMSGGGPGGPPGGDPIGSDFHNDRDADEAGGREDGGESPDLNDGADGGEDGGEDGGNVRWPRRTELGRGETFVVPPHITVRLPRFKNHRVRVADPVTGGVTELVTDESGRVVAFCNLDSAGPADRCANNPFANKGRADAGEKSAAAPVPPPDTKPDHGPQSAMSYAEACEAVWTERQYQRLRWGRRRSQPYALSDGFDEAKQSVGDFLTFIDHYLMVAKATLATESGTAGPREAVRKIAALALSCIEQHGVCGRDRHALVINGHDNAPAGTIGS